MTSQKGRLGEILIAAGKISDEQLEVGLEKQRQSGQPLGMTLVHMGFLDEESLIRLLAKQLSLPMARLQGKRVSDEVIERVPVELARRHHCFPLFLKEESGAQVLYLGMEDATDLEALEAVAGHVDMEVRPVLVATSEIDQALARHYGDAAPAPVDEPESLVPAEPEKVPAEPEEAAADPEEAAAEPEQAAAAPEGAAEDHGALPEGWDPEIAGELEMGVPEAGEPEPPLEEPPHPGIEEPAPEPEDPAGEALAPAEDVDAAAAPEAAEPALAEDPAIELTEEPATDTEVGETPSASQVSQEAILRALSQLLVEKGVITREEFVTRVHRESETARARRP